MKNSLKSHLIKLALLFICIFPAVSDAAVLHAVILGDTHDFLGEDIESGLEYMKKEVKDIATYTGLKLSLTVVEGKNFNTKKIYQTLNDIKIRKEDVIFFYSLSHGFREGNKDNRWPNIHIPPRVAKGEYGEGMDQWEVSQILMSKSPRLLVSMVASCNSVASVSIPRVESPFRKKEINFGDKQELIKRNYKKLFLESTGTIVISSSNPEQYSFVDDIYGEVFTGKFLNTLHEMVEKNEVPSWSNLLNSARSKTSVVSDGNQVPQFEFISYSSGNAIFSND